MKKFFLICVFTSQFYISNAQRIGMKAGLSLTNAYYEYSSNSISTSSLVGFQLGLIGEIPISNKLYLNSGILYSQKGTRMRLSGVDKDFPINYLEVPLNIESKYAGNTTILVLHAGPYIGFGVSANVEHLKKIDVGFNFGAGIEMRNIQIGINYGLGLTNLSNDPNEVMKNGVLSLSAAVFFGQ